MEGIAHEPEQAAEPKAAWPRTIELESPVLLGDDEITRLVFPEPLAKHGRRLGSGDMTYGTLMQVAADWCGQLPAVMKALGARDANKVMLWLNEAFTPLEKAGFDPETMQTPELPYTLTLRKPLQLGSRHVTTFTIKQTRASHFYGIPAGTVPQMGHFLDAASKMLAEPPDVVGRMGLEDAAEMIRVVQGFFHGFRGI